jgi:hypothetical protein
MLITFLTVLISTGIAIADPIPNANHSENAIIPTKNLRSLESENFMVIDTSHDLEMSVSSKLKQYTCDINDDGNVNLVDAILILEILVHVDIQISSTASDHDIGTDNRIGTEEVIYILQILADLDHEDDDQLKLTALPQNSQARLDWNDSKDPAFSSYTVYYAFTSGGPYIKIADHLVSSEYNVRNLKNSIEYFFVVTETDKTSTESAYSNEVSSIPADLSGLYFLDPSTHLTKSDDTPLTVPPISWAPGMTTQAVLIDPVDSHGRFARIVFRFAKDDRNKFEDGFYVSAPDTGWTGKQIINNLFKDDIDWLIDSNWNQVSGQRYWYIKDSNWEPSHCDWCPFPNEVAYAVRIIDDGLDGPSDNYTIEFTDIVYSHNSGSMMGLSAEHLVAVKTTPPAPPKNFVGYRSANACLEIQFTL